MELRLDNAKDVVEQTRYYTINGEPVAVRPPDDNVPPGHGTGRRQRRQR